MPSRDDDFNDLDLPSFAADEGDKEFDSSAGLSSSGASSSNRSAPAKAAGKTQGKANGLGTGVILTLFVLVILGGAAATGWLYQQLQASQQALAVASDRIASLEQRLSSTDESMSQSSVTMQIRLKDLTEKTNKLWEQMDKLWASAWRRNQKEIGDLVSGMKTLKTDMESVQKSARQLSAQAKSQRSSLEDADKKMQTQLASLQSMDAKLQKLMEQSKAQSDKAVADLGWLSKKINITNNDVSDVRAKLKSMGNNDALERQHAELTARVKSNEDWVASINKHRIQVNAQIKQLQETIREMQRSRGNSFNPVYPGVSVQPGVK